MSNARTEALQDMYARRDRWRTAKDAESAQAAGKLSENKREEIGRVGSEHRAEMPAGDFLEPSQRKYPVKANGKYDRALLLAAAREARMHGRHDLAERADNIRYREFGEGKEEAKDVDQPRDNAGRFSGGNASSPEQHMAASEEHKQASEYHRHMAGGNAISSHHAAVRGHNTASSLHRGAAEGRAGFADHARAATVSAAKSSAQAMTDEPQGNKNHAGKMPSERGVIKPEVLK